MRCGTFGPQPFGDAVIGQLSHDGTGLFVLERPAVQDAVDAEFRLTRLNLSGDTVFTRTYPYQPAPLPREKVDSAIEARAESFHRFVGERTSTTLAQWERWVADAMYAPSHYPPVGQVLAGRDGTVWLALSPQRSDGREWLVLNAEGDPIAKIVTPEKTRVLMADGHNVWGVEHDSLVL